MKKIESKKELGIKRENNVIEKHFKKTGMNFYIHETRKGRLYKGTFRKQKDVLKFFLKRYDRKAGKSQ